jgi:FtsP/CotA-like multicopper oxidase with cupredoxin domain
MTRLRYRVVATSFPIVYTPEGDHDPAGLLYTLATSAPLLEWARRQWDWNDEWLPRAHERAQRIEMLVDALLRYDQMVARLKGTGDEDLLAYEGPPDGIVPAEPPEEPDDLDDAPARRERRQHLRHTVDEVVGLLRLLTGSDIRTVGSKADRDRRRKEWAATLPGLRAAIEARLDDIAKDWEVQLAALIEQITAAMTDRRLARRIRNPYTDADRRRRGWLIDRMRRLVLNNQARTVDGVLRYTRFNPVQPFDLVRPLVLRARRGDSVDVTVQNSIRGRTVGFHRQGSGADGPGGRGVRFGDGAAVGENPATTIPPGQHRTFRWDAEYEGIWPVNDLADIRSSEAGTNIHGLFGAFVVLPPGTRWHDPETGVPLTGTDFADGLSVDVHRLDQKPNAADTTPEWVDFQYSGIPRGYREFTIVFHDEPEVHGALHRISDEPAVMPISYRAEPLHNRLPHRMRQLVRDTEHRPMPAPGKIDLSAVRRLVDDNLAEVFEIGRRSDGKFVERVSGEEQHHSSWLFGDPVTPILRAYAGDPARVQLVHAGIKETHVFHLHVHQWHAVWTDSAAPSRWRPDEPRGSQLIDSITIGPQHGFTIDPLYGSGSRQHAPGDVIWHCHLYPHFHHGMWGLWRSFDREIPTAVALPDGSVCRPLKALPGRPQKSGDRPGFPWFIDARYPQKAPPPPARNDAEIGGRRRLLGMPRASANEKAAMVANPKPGGLFVDLDGNARTWNDRAKLPARGRLIHVEVEVLPSDIVYNRRGWHDPLGHRYRVTGIRVFDRIDMSGNDKPVVQELPLDPTDPHEPLFVRAHHGDVVELTLTNSLNGFPADHFDVAQLPVECGLHVHLVKFDVLAADGSSTGWNYLSGASCRDAVPGVSDTPGSAVTSFHRWVVDEEFGPSFFHDHLLANYRQKRGLFAALIAEPAGSRWVAPDSVTDPAARTAWTGTQAVVLPGSHPDLRFEPFREACLGIGDFIPSFEPERKNEPADAATSSPEPEDAAVSTDPTKVRAKALGRAVASARDPLNPPGELGGDDDPGIMGVNYRNAPLTFRGDDPSRWFARRDPDTGVIRTHPNDRLRIRLIQGSHEEQHSFVTHGLNWRREWQNPDSPFVGQVTLGISEAFTLDIGGRAGMPYGLGDHMWRLSGMDDLWLGCWGIVRAEPRNAPKALPTLPDAHDPAPLSRPIDGSAVRHHVVRARRVEHRYDGARLTDPWGLVYELVPKGSLAPAFDPDCRDGEWLLSTVAPTHNPEPLVLRCRPGEWVHITFLNEVKLAADRPADAAGSTPCWTALRFEDPDLPPLRAENHPPPLPLDEEQRTVSSRVSLHPSLLRYDVVAHDGAHVGHNHDSTVSALPVTLVGEHDVPHPAVGATIRGAGEDKTAEATGGIEADPDGDPLVRHRTDRTNVRDYWWYADPKLLHGSPQGRVCYLHDMADIRNHRHHGLVGAVVVEPKGVDFGDEPPVGPAATLTANGTPVHERVVFWQDGLRLYLAGSPNAPVPDVEDNVDAEDAGQRGINYRTALLRSRRMLRDDHPPTPVWQSPAGGQVWLRLVGACDKPRNHTFTVHGIDWAVAPWQGQLPRASALSGLSADTAHDIVMVPRHGGDHAFRSGAFRWSVEQGMWGILRIRSGNRSPGYILNGLIWRATWWIRAKAPLLLGRGR